MANFRLPEQHIDEPEREIIRSVGEYQPDTIGDIPEFAEIFNSLYKQLLEAKGETLPDASDFEAEILPVGDGEAYPPTGESEPDKDTAQRRNMAFLRSLPEQFGPGSDLFRVTLRDRKTQEVRQEPYFAAVLNNQDGSPFAVVADTETEDNALYVWRSDLPADLQPNKSWVEVFKGDKASARNEHKAVHIKHTGMYEDRVINLLTMPTEQFTEFVTAEKRPRL